MATRVNLLQDLIDSLWLFEPWWYFCYKYYRLRRFKKYQQRWRPVIVGSFNTLYRPGLRATIYNNIVWSNEPPLP